MVIPLDLFCPRGVSDEHDIEKELDQRERPVTGSFTRFGYYVDRGRREGAGTRREWVDGPTVGPPGQVRGGDFRRGECVDEGVS